MTKKEKQELGILISKMIECSNILYAPLGGILFDQISESTDSEVLDILIDHMNEMRTYLIYERFNREASKRDIKKLLKIIEETRKGK